MTRAGIELIIATWWGIDGSGETVDNGNTDRVFNKIINEWMFQPCMPRVRWSVHVDRFMGGDNLRRRDNIYRALKHIVLNYGNSPYFARLYGAPLIFVYSVKRDEIPEFYEAVRRLWQEGIIVYLNVDSPHVQPGPDDARGIIFNPPLPNFPEAIFAFQACHIYDPVYYTIQATGGGSLTHSRSVSPGFWHYRDTSARLLRDPVKYQEAWDRFADITSRHSSTSDQYVQFLLITTWNEYNEGTQIEPAHRVILNDADCFSDAGSYGTTYVDITANAVAQFKRGPDCEAHNGDVDNNGCVDDTDLLAVLFALGCTVGDLGRVDVNCDGTVDDTDLLIVLFNLGSGC